MGQLPSADPGLTAPGPAGRFASAQGPPLRVKVEEATSHKG